MPQDDVPARVLADVVTRAGLAEAATLLALCGALLYGCWAMG